MQMKWRELTAAVLLSQAACASFPLFLCRKEPQAVDAQLSEVPGRVTLELQDIHYDGEVLSGRLLIGAESGLVRLDKRLVSRADVHVNAVFECESSTPTAFIMADVLPPPAHEEDLLILAPGYWYGTTVRFKLFSEHFTGRGPACIEAELTVFSFEGKPLAGSRVRATVSTP